MKKRPVILSVICIIGFLWIVFTFPGMFSPSTKKLGDWVPAIYGFIIAFSFISFIGVWNMKRWGVEMYIAVFFSKQVFFLLTNQMGISEIIGIIFSAWFIITFIVYYKRMSLNL